jgi:nitrogen fixation protein NifQ
MTGYTDTIRRYAMDTRRSGALADADGVGEVGLGAAEAGRRLAVRFALRVGDGRTQAVRFQVFGCGFTIAACAVAAELAEGRTLSEIPDIAAADVDAALGGLPPERGYCADLAIEALHAAVASARSDARAVRSAFNPLEDHGPRVSADDPVYSALMGSPAPESVAEEDRHLFSCLLAVAAREPHHPAEALGLSRDDLKAIMAAYFPGFDLAELKNDSLPAQGDLPGASGEVLDILLSHIPTDGPDCRNRTSAWLARIIAARAAHPGHLWTAMGFFKRSELTAAIRRHLPSLAAANSRGMRWKRYLFKQVCDLHGAVLCKSPNCGTCSDRALCFDPEE